MLRKRRRTAWTLSVSYQAWGTEWLAYLLQTNQTEREHVEVWLEHLSRRSSEESLWPSRGVALPSGAEMRFELVDDAKAYDDQLQAMCHVLVDAMAQRLATAR